MAKKKISKPNENWPRVTQIIGAIMPDAGLDWMIKNKPQELAAYAADGTEYHGWLDKIAKGKKIYDNPEFLGLQCRNPGTALAVENSDFWFDKNVAEVYISEGKIHSDRHQYRGTVDLVCRFKFIDGIIILDYKRRDSVGRSAALQTAGYYNGLVEMGLIKKGEKVRRAILKCPRSTNIPSLKWLDTEKDSQIDADTNAFLCCVSLYGWTKANPN